MGIFLCVLRNPILIQFLRGDRVKKFELKFCYMFWIFLRKVKKCKISKCINLSGVLFDNTFNHPKLLVLCQCLFLITSLISFSWMLSHTQYSFRLTLVRSEVSLVSTSAKLYCLFSTFPNTYIFCNWSVMFL